MIEIIESPRDAMQGIKTIIPTEKKVEYLRSLLCIGLNIIDCGSFVSPKAIPQLADTGEVLRQIETVNTKSKILILTGNEQGAETAMQYSLIAYLGFPFSISETFLKKNINKDFNQAEEAILRINELCKINSKELILYITMAFGNPYGDDWSIQMIVDWIGKFRESGIKFYDLTDILGLSNASMIADVYNELTFSFPDCKFGFHLHSENKDWYSKIEAAYLNGCQVFDSVLSGAGGCPMTGYDMLGNIDTLKILAFLDKHNSSPEVNLHALKNANKKAHELFYSYK
ncbi:hydroxymethylglutaryl-CoA lyase [Bacteroidota bacterium]